MTDNSIFNFNIDSTTNKVDHHKRIKLHCSDKDNQLHERLYEKQLESEKYLQDNPESCIFYRNHSYLNRHNNNKLSITSKSIINPRVTKCGVPVIPSRQKSSTVEPIVSRKKYITNKLQRMKRV